VRSDARRLTNAPQRSSGRTTNAPICRIDARSIPPNDAHSVCRSGCVTRLDEMDALRVSTQWFRLRAATGGAVGGLYQLVALDSGVRVYRTEALGSSGFWASSRPVSVTCPVVALTTIVATVPVALVWPGGPEVTQLKFPTRRMTNTGSEVS
jgi:hypothetical protein